jgi:hypothetical protein
MMQKIKNVIKRITYSIIPPPYSRNSYSEAGEDMVIDFLLQGTGNNKPTYLELGTNNPDWGNNTYLFYKRGAKGVLVEADETIIPSIKKIRPNDKLINVGAGSCNQKEADFYIFEIGALNTFSKEEAEHREKNGTYKIIKVAKVQLNQ